jgi:predicted permease
MLPFSGNTNASVILIDGYVRAPGENPPVPGWNNVDPGYFQALGIPLLQGRLFNEADRKDTQPVAIIDEFMAKKYWPNGNAIGAGLRRGVNNNNPVVRVVGIVGAVKTSDLADSKPVGVVYFPHQQTTPRFFHVVVKERGNGQLLNPLRQELQRADPEMALFDVKPMEDRIAGSMGNRRAAMWLCLVFGGLAMVLSAIGIYGVLAYTVTQRTREFGIRLALGAEGRDVVNMVIGYGVKLAVIGLAIGIGGAIALTRLMTEMLFEVKPTDPAVFAGVAAVLMVVALVASLIPSLRVIRIKPAAALRYE